MILLLFFILLIITVGAVAVLSQMGMMPWSAGGGGDGRIPRMSELNQGCLLGLVIASFVWFAAWGLVLVLSLGFLRSVI